MKLNLISIPKEHVFLVLIKVGQNQLNAKYSFPKIIMIYQKIIISLNDIKWSKQCYEVRMYWGIWPFN